MKYTITGVIPVAQYANVQPTIEVEADTWEEAQRIADARLREVWALYADKGKELANQGAAGPWEVVKITSPINNVSALFDEKKHLYYTEERTPLLSGSQFAAAYKPPFQKNAILKRISTKHDIPVERIGATWDLKAEISCDFGNAIHKALQLFGDYHKDGKKMDKEMLSDHPFLREVVEDFFIGPDKETLRDESARHELFVVNKELGVCGVIDRLVFDKDKKTCRIQDFKTNGDIQKQGSPRNLLEPFAHIPNTPLGCYHLQLNFYADIMESLGWKVEGLDIFHLTGTTWNLHKIEREKVINREEQ